MLQAPGFLRTFQKTVKRHDFQELNGNPDIILNINTQLNLLWAHSLFQTWAFSSRNFSQFPHNLLKTDFLLKK